MIDRVRVLIQAGDGGSGCESYFRRNDKKNLPNGGHGGNGGNIIFRADHNCDSIASYRYKSHILAESGSHGSSNKKRGRDGEDLILLVPVGTRLKELETDMLIRELAKDQEEVVAAAGGRGGIGNQGGREAREGQKGEVIDIELSFRLMVDVSLVGPPNAGKSSLLNALTRAHSKMEDYPFTTKSPEVGVCQFSDFEQITLCDFPSLYGGSHEGKGLGNDFLKHLEKSRGLLYVLEGDSEFFDSIEESWKTTREEIAIAQKDAANLQAAVVINKIDTEECRVKIEEQKPKFDIPVFEVSTKTGEGIDALKDYLMKYVED